ncbi:MAG TPA: NADPH-dependent FMN reductase [Solirubrobacteraceae bacterium]|jgi:chromate reductase
MLVLGLSGSLRRDSHNRKLLRAAAEQLPSGARLAVWDHLGELPHYDQDLDVAPAPPAVRQLRDAIAAADALLISTPEYNHSIPGGLKNALDWASRPFANNALRGKPVAVVGTSTGLFGAVWAQAETRKVLKAIGAEVVERELPVGSADSAFAEDGGLVDPDQRAELAGIVAELVAAATPEQVREEARFEAQRAEAQVR